MVGKLLLVGIVALAFYMQGSLTYETDYTGSELLRLVSNGVPLTFGRLLNGNDTYDTIDKEVTFYCINRATNTLQHTVINDTDLNSKIDTTKPLWTITHGWIDNYNRTWVQKLAREIIEVFDVNVCAVDWNKLANYEYIISATQHVPMVGDYLAEFIKYTGINLDYVTMVGHSLGAQISGRAGMKLSGKVGKIYCLDPAGPMFCFPHLRDLDNRLDRSDAQWVQCIHTADGTLGCDEDLGHQDFYPDSGTAPQNACYLPMIGDTLSPEVISCSHSHSIQYFRYSLNETNHYTGHRCSSGILFNLFGCNGNPTERLGPYHNKTEGSFYFRSGFKSPFCPK